MTDPSGPADHLEASAVRPDDERDTLEQAIAAQEQLRGAVPDAVIDATVGALRARLDAIAGRHAPKRRKQVTVLFADISGSTALAESLDAEEISDAFDALWHRLDRTIAAHNGRVDKHIGDAVMGLWGSDVAREDDAEQTIRAALAMQHEVAEFAKADMPGSNLAIRIGINTGPVVLAEVGAAAEFTAMGDTVNVASRLEGAAPVGGVLIGHDTYRHVKGIFAVRPQEPLAVKGKSEPQRTYLVDGVRPRAFRVPTRGIEGVETAMIGRDAELRSLQDALRDVSTSGTSRFVTVVGEAGIGKSRLLNVFEDWLALRDEDAWLFRGRADQQHEGVPYALLRDLLFFRFEIAENEPAGVALEKLETGVTGFVGPVGREDAHFLGHLVGLDLTASSVVGGILDDARQLRERGAAAAVRLFLTAARDSPVAMLLEDIHWADNGSLDLIEHVVDACAGSPVLTVALARPLLFERRPGWGTTTAAHRRIDLGPLPESDGKRLIAEVLQRLTDVPDAVTTAILSNAEGNPFYVEEIVKMLIDGGAITTDEETWTVSAARLESMKVPPTLTGVIQSRLDRLAGAERETLQRASVVGRVFWDDAIPPPDGPDDVPRDLGTLRERSLIARHDDTAFSGTEEYAFHHALLHEVTYESVLLSRRKGYHRAVADWLAGRVEGASLAAAIARHYLAAEAFEPAARWFATAGRDAASRYANDEAHDHFERALALGTLDADAALTVYEGLGEVLLLLARYEEALATATTMREAAAAAGNDVALSSALVGSAYPLLRLGRSREALDACRKAEGVLRSLQPPDPSALAEALRSQGWMYLRLGDTGRALELGEEALALTTGAGDRRGTARTLGVLGGIHNVLGNYALAIDQFEQALAIDRERGDRRAETAWLINLGESARFQGDYARAETLHLEALSIERAFGDRDQQALSLSNLGGTYVGMGDYPRAVDHLERSLLAFEAAGGLEHVSEAHRFLAEAALGTGDVVRATREALAALELADREDAEQLGQAWRVVGLVAARLGRPIDLPDGVADGPQDADGAFDRALAIFTEAGLDHERAQCLWDRAAAGIVGGDRNRAAAWWHESRSIFERLGLDRFTAAMDAAGAPPGDGAATPRPAAVPSPGSSKPAE